MCGGKEEEGLGGGAPNKADGGSGRGEGVGGCKKENGNGGKLQRQREKVHIAGRETRGTGRKEAGVK